MTLADFSKMFMEVDDEEIPHSLKFLLDVICRKRVDALSLADNHMTPESCQLIADSFSRLHFLQDLDLSSCKIDSEGAQLLVQSLLNRSEVKLRILDLGNNSLEIEGAEAFAEYFRTYDTLESIHLNSTGLDTDGVRVLLESLTPSAASGSMFCLDIAENFISDKETVQSLCDLLKAAKRLKTLNISDLKIGKKRHQQQILEALC